MGYIRRHICILGWALLLFSSYTADEAASLAGSSKDSPFFLCYAPQLPHGPCITPDLGRYARMDWDLGADTGCVRNLAQDEPAITREKVLDLELRAQTPVTLNIQAFH
jgi:hypothetical protein